MVRKEGNGGWDEGRERRMGRKEGNRGWQGRKGTEDGKGGWEGRKGMEEGKGGTKKVTKKQRNEKRIEGRERDWVCSWWCGLKQTPLATDRTPVACYERIGQELHASPEGEMGEVI